MPDPSYISKITLPSGNTYLIKDAAAWEAIAALEGGSYFLGVTTTPLTDQATTNPIVVDGQSVTAKNGNIVVYDKSEFVFNGTKWFEFGDLSTLGALAYKDTVSATAASSAVSFSGGTTDKVLGSGATFTTTVTPTTTNIKATASGTAVAADGTAAAITGFGSHTTANVLGASATFTTTVTPTTTNIKATASGTAVGANGTDTFVKSYPGATSKLATTTVPNVTSAGSASTWAFSMGSGTDSETLIISGANSTAPTLGTAKTVATGSLSDSGSGGTVMTGLGTATTASALTGVKVTSQPTIALATGATAGSGVISVATGITSASTTTNSKDQKAAITALGTPTTANALTGVKVSTQPTVSLSTGATAGSGVISVATGITSASTTTNDKDEVTAVTGIGTGTAAAQTINVTVS